MEKRSGNPIHDWSVYRLSRQGGVPIPEWVLGYFDEVAKVLTAPVGPASPKAIADALGLATKGGRSKAAQPQTDQRHLEIVGHIVFLQDRAAAAADDSEHLDLKDDWGIMQRIADEYGLSLERVPTQLLLRLLRRLLRRLFGLALDDGRLLRGCVFGDGQHVILFHDEVLLPVEFDLLASISAE